ncbi:MAG: urease accessory protein UreD [Bosea sp. (in: a-proteobacteria)]
MTVSIPTTAKLKSFKLSGQLLPIHIRADGGVRLRFGRAGDKNCRLELHESGGYRARFPTQASGSPCEAVLINTGGGMAGGDRMRTQIVVDDGAKAVVSTQAAEKIYLSQGSDTCIETQLSVGAGAQLDWLPQETILFSGGRLKRSLDVSLAKDSQLLVCEALYFGRAAMGELLKSGSFQDRWRIRRNNPEGRPELVFAEDVRLDGLLNIELARKAVANGARAVATLLVLRPDAEKMLESVRQLLDQGLCEAGATAYNGMLIVRLLGPDAAALRRSLVTVITHVTQRALPRVWTL